MSRLPGPYGPSCRMGGSPVSRYPHRRATAQLAVLAGSTAATGKTYGEKIRPLPATVKQANTTLLTKALSAPEVESFAGCELVFSALPADAAREIEPALAQAGIGVVSNASAFRMTPDVPLIVPEVNPEHLGLLIEQRKQRGWKGFIVTNPNCSVVGLAMALAPLDRAFGLESAAVVTLQALSGAGYPGVASLDATDNVIPYIGGGEEEKIEAEPRKILGRFAGGAFTPADFTLSASVHRVAVSDGHTMAVFVRLRSKASAAEAKRSAGSFSRAVNTAASTLGGMVWRCSVIDRGCSVMTRAMMACAVAPVNGGSAVSIS